MLLLHHIINHITEPAWFNRVMTAVIKLPQIKNKHIYMIVPQGNKNERCLNIVSEVTQEICFYMTCHAMLQIHKNLVLPVKMQCHKMTVKNVFAQVLKDSHVKKKCTVYFQPTSKSCDLPSACVTATSQGHSSIK